MRTSIPAAAGTLLLLLAGTASVHAQATRTWVSGAGNDTDPCSRTAPCKTFAGAMMKTAASGVINCLDPGGFGTVTITKSITIDCAGMPGGILASSGTTGVNVSGAGIVVVLRALEIDGAGSGAIGINFINGGFGNALCSDSSRDPSDAPPGAGMCGDSFCLSICRAAEMPVTSA